MGQTDRSDKVPLTHALQEIYRQESRRFVLWLPVCMGAGIWWYFAMETEPDPLWGLLWALPLLLLVSGLPRRLGWGALAAGWLMLAVLTGFALALLSARMADAPVVPHPMGETVEGRVLSHSRSASGAPRLLLDRLVIYGVEPGRTPARLRLTVLDPVPAVLPRPGERVRVYASLMPPGEPVEPGAFDFRRRAFFERIGGVALSRGVLVPVPPDRRSVWDGARIWLADLRLSISQAINRALPGPEGAFAAAIIVGDRSRIGDADAEALRAANLAHLLAISGLHMGILTGLIFAVARLGLSVVPQIALRWPTKKVAALCALAAGAAYLGLSGATVATQRAFVMVSVALIAVMLDRPAITLRALALAAAIILAIRPISLLDAGFQMSFAATAALVAGFEAVRRRPGERPRQPRSWPLKIARILAVYVGALLFSSLLAGLATAPFAAFHFNRTAPYGLPANLLAVPVMGLWIAPSACIAAVLAPFGLSDWALQAMGWGISHILWVAHWISSLPGAVRPVHAAPDLVLGVLAVGGLWLVLWRGPWRWAGVAIVALGLGQWQAAPPRPDLLIARDARLIGVMSATGRALDHAKAQGFAARTWLRRDGDLSAQDAAAARMTFERIKGGLGAPLPHGWRLETRWSKRVTVPELRGLCREKVLLVAREGPRIEGPCRYLGKRALARAGAVAVIVRPDGLDIQFSRETRRRLWSHRQ